MNNMVLYLGHTISLTTGESVKLLGGIDGKAFVEFPHLVEREVRLKDGSAVPIGKSYKAWVPAKGFKTYKDKHGALVGLSLSNGALS